MKLDKLACKERSKANKQANKHTVDNWNGIEGIICNFLYYCWRSRNCLLNLVVQLFDFFPSSSYIRIFPFCVVNFWLQVTTNKCFSFCLCLSVVWRVSVALDVCLALTLNCTLNYSFEWNMHWRSILLRCTWFSSGFLHFLSFSTLCMCLCVYVAIFKSNKNTCTFSLFSPIF